MTLAALVLVVFTIPAACTNEACGDAAPGNDGGGRPRAHRRGSDQAGRAAATKAPVDTGATQVSPAPTSSPRLHRDSRTGTPEGLITRDPASPGVRPQQEGSDTTRQPGETLEPPGPEEEPRTRVDDGRRRNARGRWKASVTAGHGEERLTRGHDPWRETSWRGTVRRERETSRRERGPNRFDMVLRRTRRFGLDDDEVAASVAGRATNQVTAAVGGAVSGNHHVLPQWSLHGAAHVEAGGGWVLGGSISRREYTDASVTIPTSITELYSGSFRFAYTFSRPRLHGDGVAHSHGVQVDLYYGSGDRGRLGVIASRGEEMESIGTSVSRTRVASYTLRGLHPLDHQWSLEWRVGRHRQGSHYTRRGAWLGLVLEF